MEKMSIIELKALAYDILAGIEQAQQQLKLVNQEIMKKVQAKGSTNEKPAR